MHNSNVILAGLNPMQKDAVTTFSGPILVLAGAGSGKTKVIAHRVAFLINNGVNPYNILCITFTNKASEEMKSRIGRLIGVKAKKLTVLTFHSFGLKILREIENQVPDGFIPRKFIIYDDDDQNRLIRKCLEELNMEGYETGTLAARISSAKNELISPKVFLEKYAYDVESKITGMVYKLYQNKLMNSKALDFDDLITVPVKVFTAFPQLLYFYQNKYKFVLIDEYQDVNHAQYRLANLLAFKHKNICVVGDPDQSIYTWRGADIRNILAFEKDYPNAKVIKLEQNYRSTKNILRAATEIIKNNKQRKEKTLWTLNEKGEYIKLLYAEDEKQEAYFITNMVMNLCSNKYNYNDILILYRTHSQSRRLEEQFIEFNIPHKIVGGIKFYQRKEIKDMVSFLRLMINKNDEISLSRVLNVCTNGIGNVSIDKIINFIKTNSFDNLDNINGLTRKGKNSLLEFVKTIKSLEKFSINSSITSLVKMILNKTSYFGLLNKPKDDLSSQTRIENLKEFITLVSEFEEKNKNKSALEKFLEDISLYGEDKRIDDLTSSVTLMTVHNAKGTEFPVVFICGMEDGLFPYFKSYESKYEMEEERRLFHVGLTRAKERVYLTCAMRRSIFGEHYVNKVSRFILETPVDVIENVKAGVFAT